MKKRKTLWIIVIVGLALLLVSLPPVIKGCPWTYPEEGVMVRDCRATELSLIGFFIGAGLIGFVVFQFIIESIIYFSKY